MEKGKFGMLTLASAMAVFLMGCLEGPAGPAGPAGPSGGTGGGQYRDSVVLDLMNLAVYYAKHYHDSKWTAVQFSPDIENRYRSFDTSHLMVDTVIDPQTRRKYQETFVKTKYPITEWAGVVSLKNMHDCKVGGEAPGWFAKFSQIDTDYSGDPEGKVGVEVLTPHVCVLTETTPDERRQYHGGFYFPGRGVTLTWQGLMISLSHRFQYAEGSLTLYYR